MGIIKCLADATGKLSAGIRGKVPIPDPAKEGGRIDEVERLS
jgi:hypothetical protein